MRLLKSILLILVCFCAITETLTLTGNSKTTMQLYPGSIDFHTKYRDTLEGHIGISYSLNNRKIISFPERPLKINYSGKVSQNIQVNKNGKVIYVQLSRPTSNNPKLQSLARSLSTQIQFDSCSNCDVQNGTITYDFVK